MDARQPKPLISDKNTSGAYSAPYQRLGFFKKEWTVVDKNQESSLVRQYP